MIFLNYSCLILNKTKKIMKLGIWNHVPTFIYPKDDKWYCKILACRSIVVELEKRDFRVPDVEVKFSINGYGMKKLKYVSNVEWNGIEIFFCLSQGPLPGYEGVLNDIAGLTECSIPSLGIVSFYSDGSGEYVSQKEIDAYNAALQPLLEHIQSFTEIKDRGFKESLSETEDDFQRQHFEAYPEHYPTLYVKNYNKRGCIEKFVKGFENLPDSGKIMFLGGARLVHLFTNNDNNDIEIDPISKDGFSWAFIGEDKLNKKLKMHSDYDADLIFEIRPHYSDNIYVADLSTAEKYRSKCFESSNNRLNNKQYDRYIRLRGVRLVTLKEYIENDMEFKKLQYLIHKPIGFDEISQIYNVTGGNVEIHKKQN